MGTPPMDKVQAFGKYALIEKLGEGYLGPVYRGFDQDLGQAVVIRILCDGIKWDPAIEQLYNTHCKAIADLQHRNIVAIHDFGKEGQDTYIVMESLGSHSIKDIIVQKSAITVETKLSMMIQVAEGMSYAHKKGILHYDLGPSKIHLTSDGCIKIRDFGIASVLKNRLPHPAVRFGVPIYLSPEQVQKKNGDVRSDIFAAGTIFYELITYLHPFHDPNSNIALDNILSDKPIPTFERFPEAPPGIWTILKTCLAKDPRDRYPNMDELVNACRDLQQSLAEDTRLMIAELYASMNSLKKAAAQPGASKETQNLLQEIQNLSHGDKEADYTSLDRLVTVLTDQYPAIQAAANLPDPISPQLFPEEKEAVMPAEPEAISSENPDERIDGPPQEQPVAAAVVPDTPEPVAESDEIPQMAFDEAPVEEETIEGLQKEFAKSDDFQDEMQDIPEIPCVEPEELPEAEDMSSTESDNDAEEARLPEPAVIEPEKEAIPLSSQTAAVENNNMSQPLEPASEKLDAPVIPPQMPATAFPNNEAIPPSIPAAPALKDDTLPLPKQTAAEATVNKAWGFDPLEEETDFKTAQRSTSVPIALPPRRRMSKPSYRAAVVLLSILVIVTAGYIVLAEVPEPIRKAWDYILANSPVSASTFGRSNRGDADGLGTKKALDENTVSVLLDEARALAADKRFGESKAIIRRILDNNPGNAEAAALLKIVKEKEQRTRQEATQLKKKIREISALIDAGNLQSAKTELNNLQQEYPAAPELVELLGKWEAKSSRAAREPVQRKVERKNALWRQKDDAYARQLSNLFARGKYDEAVVALSDWLDETPDSSRALEYSNKVENIRRGLNAYSLAVSENRYEDAFNALLNVERINPGDPKLPELRRQIEEKKASARAMLTVRRLGGKATILLDGRPVGNDGELESGSIGIGSHTLSIENSGGLVASRTQDYYEGQHIVYVYDLARLNLRPMVEDDNELIVKRKAMEESYHFEVEHKHGIFRGSCHGVLSVNFLDISYKPTEGDHGFHIPFKLLKLSGSGKSLDLYYISDNKQFQSFKFKDRRDAYEFQRIWGNLKALARNNP